MPTFTLIDKLSNDSEKLGAYSKVFDYYINYISFVMSNAISVSDTLPNIKVKCSVAFESEERQIVKYLNDNSTENMDALAVFGNKYYSQPSSFIRATCFNSASQLDTIIPRIEKVNPYFAWKRNLNNRVEGYDFYGDKLLPSEEIRKIKERQVQEKKAWQEKVARETRNPEAAQAALGLGIASVAAFGTGIFASISLIAAIIFAVAGFILGIIAQVKAFSFANANKGMIYGKAKVGKILGTVGTAVSVLPVLFSILINAI